MYTSTIRRFLKDDMVNKTDRKYSICFVMPWYYQEQGGGAELQAWYHAREAARRKILTYYICQTHSLSRVNTEEILEGVRVIWLKKSSRFDWSDQTKYKLILDRILPDIVIQRISLPVSYTIGKYCLRHRKKFIWICTDNTSCSRWMFLRRQRAENQKQRVNTIKRVLFNLNALIRDVYRQRGMGMIDQAFHQNAYQKALIKQNFNLNSHPIICGHPVRRYKVQSEAWKNRPVVLWVGNLGHRKNPEKFINFASNCLKTNWHFVMVGGTSNKKYYEDLITLGSKSVTMTGRLPLEETEEWFNRASICVNTSTTEGEGFPNTFVQAWLRGIPIISFNIDPDGILSKNRLGFKVSSFDEAKIKISALLSDQEEYAKLRKNIQEFASKHFSIEHASEEFLKSISMINT